MRFKFSVFLLCTGLIALTLACQSGEKLPDKPDDAEILHESVRLLNEVIVYDIFSPPVASRIYVYAFLAAHETAKFISDTGRTFEHKLNDFNNLPQPDIQKKAYYPLAANLAFLYTAEKFIISREKIIGRQEEIISLYKKLDLPDEAIENSIDFAKEMSEAVIRYSKDDHYLQTRSMPKYASPISTAGWQPTPPAYMDAIEPYWSEIRPLVLDSASQFKPIEATAFSTDTSSRFWEEAEEVYLTGIQLTEEEKLIADFWDCNPYKLRVNGHVMHAVKKITPGGHWVSITGIACQKDKKTLEQSTEIYSWISIGLFDGFISCWTEKYTSNVIRPETYINQYMDKTWKPYLQTPPFPEYTSGHSVISTISGELLSYIFGPNYDFTDDTEVIFGIPERNFSSFEEAAKEAAISRLYGGIHYRPAIVNGITQGKNIADHILSHIQ